MLPIILFLPGTPPVIEFAGGELDGENWQTSGWDLREEGLGFPITTALVCTEYCET